jgi:hypothetical protein
MAKTKGYIFKIKLKEYMLRVLVAWSLAKKRKSQKFITPGIH